VFLVNSSAVALRIVQTGILTSLFEKVRVGEFGLCGPNELVFSMFVIVERSLTIKDIDPMVHTLCAVELLAFLFYGIGCGIILVEIDRSGLEVERAFHSLDDLANDEQLVSNWGGVIPEFHQV